MAHYRAAEHYEKYYLIVGIPAVLISAVVATAVFATLSKYRNTIIQIATGVIALMAVIFTTLQTFLKFGDRAEKHKIAGAKYHNIRRKIDMFLLWVSCHPDENIEIQNRIDKIAEELNSLSIESPSLKEKYYNEGKTEFDRDHPQEVVKYSGSL